MSKENKDIEYWKNNASEDYAQTPISVLRYICELEKLQEQVNVSLGSVSNCFKDCGCNNQIPQGMTMCINCNGEVR